MVYDDPDIEVFENIVRKGENAGNQHFLRFPQYFQPNQDRKNVNILPFLACFHFVV